MRVRSWRTRGARASRNRRHDTVLVQATCPQIASTIETDTHPKGFDVPITRRFAARRQESGARARAAAASAAIAGGERSGSTSRAHRGIALRAARRSVAWHVGVLHVARPALEAAHSGEGILLHCRRGRLAGLLSCE